MASSRTTGRSLFLTLAVLFLAAGVADAKKNPDGAAAAALSGLGYLGGE